MRYISIFDIIGPIMIGPSSSHTAGAIRIGLFARKIFGKRPEKVLFRLYNSFAKTGLGHGTDKGLLGGVLGFNVDDSRIKNSFYYAREQGVVYNFEYDSRDDRHPNSVDIIFMDTNNNMLMEVSGKSIGGGEVQIDKIDGFNTDIRGDYSVLIMVYKDQKGVISNISKLIQDENVNIATINCERKEKNQEAVLTICLDSVLTSETIEEIRKLPDMYMVRNIDKLEE